MSTIVTRAGKGSALTWIEADANFTNLNTDKVEYTRLDDSDGSSLVKFTQSDIDAVPRTVQSKLQDYPSVKDWGAKGDNINDDTVEILNALNAGVGPIYFPPGIYRVSSEIVVPMGSGIIGAQAFWKRRTIYTYDATKETVFKRTSAGGANSCVIRASVPAVGVEGTTFGSFPGDDLVAVQMRDFHVDCQGLTDFGVYVYRAGNQCTFNNITAEKAKKYNHVHLGCFAAVFGTFGAYESQEHGVAIGSNIFSWSSAEATCFAYYATFLLANNGTDGTYVAGTATDLDGSGGKFSVGRGSVVRIISESNDGRSCILSQHNIGSSAGGTTTYLLEYLEGSGEGPYIDYRDSMDSLYLKCGFLHPGNGSSLLPQNIKIDGKNDAGTTTANSGPTRSSEWLVLEGIVGDLSGTGPSVSSNTYKYHVRHCTDTLTYSGTAPALGKNGQNQVGAGVYFSAAASPAIFSSLNGVLTRSSVGTYLFTFIAPFKAAGAQIPSLSIVLDAGAPLDTKTRLTSLSTTSAIIRTYDSTDTLADTGDRIGFSLIGELI